MSFPPLTSQAVTACAFSSWYPKYRKHAPKATVIPLPPDFLDYLHADGVFLPRSQLEEIDNDDDPARNFSFPQLDEQISQVIDKYGAVFPKLDWSSPQDAAWMSATSTLRCTTPEEIYLLLKSSDFVVHDLDHAFEDCKDVQNSRDWKMHLVLKMWFEMPKANEFRCFIRQNKLIGICQRDTNVYYSFLTTTESRSTISQLITSFWEAQVKDTFELQDYTMDVYLTRNLDRCFIIDFNPFAPRTDPLLFSWDELLSLSLDTPAEWRVLQNEAEASQSMPRYSHNRYPKEAVQLSDGKSIEEFVSAWKQELDTDGAIE